MSKPHLLGICSPSQWLLSLITMIVVIGSTEGIAAAIRGMPLIIIVITTNELMQPPTSIKELRLVRLVPLY